MALLNLAIQAMILLLGVIVTLWEVKAKYRWRYLSAFGALAIASCLVGFIQEKESDARQERTEGLLKQLSLQGTKISPLRVEVVKPGEEAVRRRAVREQLGRFLEEGKKLQDNLPSELKAQEQALKSWSAKVEQYLRENLDPSYESRFKSVNYDYNPVFLRINAKMRVLVKFMEELKD